MTTKKKIKCFFFRGGRGCLGFLLYIFLLFDDVVGLYYLYDNENKIHNILHFMYATIWFTWNFFRYYFVRFHFMHTGIHAESFVFIYLEKKKRNFLSWGGKVFLYSSSIYKRFSLPRYIPTTQNRNFFFRFKNNKNYFREKQWAVTIWV